MLIQNAMTTCYNTHIRNASILLLSWLTLTVSAIGQNTSQEKMKDLGYMIGDWVGTSSTYRNGTIDKEVPAFQKISYDLDSTIIVIELHSELLQLHTIIRYDDKDHTYYYYPFSKKGINKSPAEYKGGQLIVWSSESNRYIFRRTGRNSFQEYGEKLINNKWVKYFEDNFKNIQ